MVGGPAPSFANASSDFRFAFAVAAFADVLRGGADAEHWSLASDPRHGEGRGRERQGSHRARRADRQGDRSSRAAPLGANRSGLLASARARHPRPRRHRGSCSRHAARAGRATPAHAARRAAPPGLGRAGQAPARSGRRRDQDCAPTRARPRARSRRLPGLASGQRRCRRVSSRGPRPATRTHAHDRDPLLHGAARRSRQLGDKRGRRRSGRARSRLRDPQPRPYTAIAYDWLHDAAHAERSAITPAQRWKAWLALVSREGLSRARSGLELPGRLSALGDDDRDRRGRRRRRRRHRAVAVRSPTRCGARRWRPRSPTRASSPAATGPKAGSTVRSRSPSTRSRARIARGAGIEVNGGSSRGSPRCFAATSTALSPADGVYAGRRHRGREAEPRAERAHARCRRARRSAARRQALGARRALAPQARRSRLLALRRARRRRRPPGARAARSVADLVRRRGHRHAVRADALGRARDLVRRRVPRQHRDAITAIPTPATSCSRAARDDVIVDPSPYGSQSTLTSNAPTVRVRTAAARLPAVAGGVGRARLRLLHARASRRGRRALRLLRRLQVPGRQVRRPRRAARPRR